MVSLRSNRTLILLALMLFTLELATPVFAAVAIPDNKATDKICINCHGLCQNLFIPLLEELNENEGEDEKDDGKAPDSKCCCIVSDVCRFDLELEKIDFYTLAVQKYTCASALFKAQRKLQI